MKRIKNSLRVVTPYVYGTLFLLLILLVNQSCAVIAGGSKYYAHVVVDGHPSAEIKYDGLTKGYGNTTIKLPRRDADKILLTISDDGCPTIQRSYTQRTFRGWSFVGTLVTWTGLTVNGGPWLPIPFGVMVDGPTGAWWKPDVNENGISKTDYKNYNYNIKYTECDKAADIQENKDVQSNSEIELTVN
ncbi:hypothetical protein [Carboxylicivirga caseinilyticus]|uniref:hypothetical protein n=1 Tax=Carboxylicivirga caseinilyticus TaxID=3417572 RepID=UPI003D354B54|nr:hypothetical protein [Marinilabiliaceae bacterium A049]